MVNNLVTVRETRNGAKRATNNRKLAAKGNGLHPGG
jgi:hypothetical protein